jgi:protocatechuate 3,4-dioxygenase beta subunit
MNMSVDEAVLSLILVVSAAIGDNRLAIAQQPKPSATSTIEGKVVAATAGEPLADIPVWISSYLGDISTSTDANGHFLIRNVTSDQYQLRAGGARCEVQDYKERAQFGTASNSSLEEIKTFYLVNGKQVRDVVFHVEPGCAISGTVSDEDGQPIDGITVLVDHPSLPSVGGISSSGSGAVQTNPFGEFCKRRLDPGPYYVMTDAHFRRPKRADGKQIDNEYIPTYYPGTTDASRATTIQIRSGEAPLKINLKLIHSRGVGVSGRVLNKSTGKPVQGAGVRIMTRDVKFASFPSQEFESPVQSETGTFQIAGVPPGSFVMMAASLQGEKPLVGFASFDVKDRDIKDVNVALGEGIELGGRVRADPAVRVDFSKISLVLMSTVNPQLGGSEAEVKADGTFVFPNAFEGRYRLHMEGFPEEFYPKSAMLGDTDVYASGIEVFQGKPLGTLEIELALDGGRIDGTVFKERKPVPQALVVLVPEPPQRDRENLYSFKLTDESGRFSMIGLPPGRFKLYARKFPEWQQMSTNDFEFLRLFADEGKPVSIQAKQVQTVDLELITGNHEQK